MASKVFLHNKKYDRTYVYNNVSYWDKKEKKPKCKRKCIGHVDPATGEIVPNRKKGDKQKMKVLTQGQEPTTASTPETTQADEPLKCSVLDCGVTVLLNQIAKETGLDTVLSRIFPQDSAAILTCAYYLVSEGQALSRAEQWSRHTLTPCGGVLADQRISELLLRITPSLTEDFFKAWIDWNRSQEYYCMDITSVSSYSELNSFVSYGYNRDGEDLPQINLLMVTGQESHIPLFYRPLPGSIKDVTTLDESLHRLELVDVKVLHLVMDKGFYSEANVLALYARHIRFVIGVPFTASLAKDAVERHRGGDMTSCTNYIEVLGDELFAVSEYITWNHHRMYLHTYFDPVKAAADEKKFGHKIRCEYQELVSGELVKEHQKDYERFFTVHETPVRGRKVEYNQAVIDAHKKNTVGWFVLATNDIKDPEKALEVYRLKDAVEKNFDDMKNDLDMNRLRIHSPQAMDGRLFIQYIAEILLSRIRTVMKASSELKNHSTQEIIDELKSVRQVTVEKKRSRIITTLTAFQKRIVSIFHLPI